MRNKKRIIGAAVGALPNSVHIPPHLPPQPKLCFEGESLALFLKTIPRKIESERASDTTLRYKFWIKQQFAVGVNEVMRVLERMTPSCGATTSYVEHIRITGDDSKAPSAYLQAILLASDCNPRWLTKHLPCFMFDTRFLITSVSVSPRKPISNWNHNKS